MGATSSCQNGRPCSGGRDRGGRGQALQLRDLLKEESGPGPGHRNGFGAVSRRRALGVAAGAVEFLPHPFFRSEIKVVFFIHKRTHEALVLSSRDMDRKERKQHAKHKKAERRDPLPDNFDSIESFWRFWDTHGSADYEDEMETADVKISLEKK